MRNVYLIWLEWPEACFRADDGDLKFFRSLVSRGSRVVRARSERAFLRALPSATHAIVWSFREEWFARAKRLRLLATPAAGRELVPSVAPRGVKIHFGGFHGQIISESVAGFILAWSHGFFRPELAASRARPWQKAWPRAALGDKCAIVSGTHAVIAGYGRIGRAVGTRLEALGVSVSGFTRRNAGDLPRAAKTADWLVLALPGDTGTDDFLDRRLIASLPRRCVVVNVGRGNAVDEDALVDALARGRLAGAYLDVFKGEPGPLAKVAGASAGILAQNPRRLPANLVMMPHSCALAREYLRLCFRELKDEGLV